MSSSASNKPLELDAVMRSIRPAVKTPELPSAPTPAAAPALQTVPSPAAAVATPVAESPDSAVKTESSIPARRPRKVERDDNRVQIDVVPALGEATVGVYLRLPKSIHQQLKTVVFQNEITEQGLQSIADISREAISDWLAKHRQRSQAA
jgi:hypothetical protein